MTQRLTIDGARPANATPNAAAFKSAPQPVVSAPKPRAIGLGHDLATAPAIPRRRTGVLALLGLGGLAFAMGVGVTIAMHRPDLLRIGAADLITDGIEVSRSALSLLGPSPAQAAATPDTSVPGTIILTDEQKRQIASVLTLADRPAQ